MIKIKKYLGVLIVFLILACQQKTEELTVLFTFPKSLKEVSGIIKLADSPFLWCIEDSGNKNKIYALNAQGKIEKSIVIQNVKNSDWEDITNDKEGNLYIGDFGNNQNIRKDLAIYKIDKEELSGTITTAVSIIRFAYPEQTAFPPKEKNRHFDVEGFFEFRGNFYLFTKNRSDPFDGTVYIYKVPNKEAWHRAEKIGEFKTGSDFDNYAITSAAISPDETKVVLLTHSKIILFENFKDDNFLSGKRTEIDLNHFSKKEAVCFKDDTSLYIADEKVKKTGGKLYEFKIQNPNPN
jgi:hypothetical protein